MPQFPTNFGGRSNTDFVPPWTLARCAVLVLAMASGGCVTSPVKESTPKVGVEAEWHSMDAAPETVDAIKQRQQQELAARQETPHTDASQPTLDAPQTAADAVLALPASEPPRTTSATARLLSPAEPLLSGIDEPSAAERPLPELPSFRANDRQLLASPPEPSSLVPAASGPLESMATQEATTAPDFQPLRLQPPAGRAVPEAIESPPVVEPTTSPITTSAEQPRLRFLGFVEDGQGEKAALLDASPGGVRLVRLGDIVLLNENGQDRELRVYEITSRALRIKDEHEEKTIYFRN